MNNRELKQGDERFSADKRTLKQVRKYQRMQKVISRSSSQKPRTGVDGHK